MIAVYINTRPKLLLVCLYIPPNCSVDYQQETLCTISILPSDTNTIILGDFNAPDINWLTLTTGSLFSRDLCNTLHLQNYLQLITFPTHQAGNILDLIHTNVPQRIGNTNVCSNTILNSDHFMITADIFSYSSTPSPRPAGTGSYSHSLETLNYRRANLSALTDNLSNALECYDQYVAHTNSLERSWSELKYAISCSTLGSVPATVLPSKVSPHWFNSNIRHQLNKVRSLHRRIKRHPTQLLKTRLEQIESDLQRIFNPQKKII